MRDYVRIAHGMRQMALYLFPTAKHDPWEGFLEWARESKGWIPEFVEGAD